MTFLILKLLTSIFVVIVMAEISKRINPELGGILSGMPLGTGLAVYFISYQMGNDFIIESIPWGIAGLASSIIFCLSYFLIGRCLDKFRKDIQVVLCSSVSIGLFLLAGYIINRIHITWMYSILLFFIVFFANLMLLRRYLSLTKDIQITKVGIYLSLLMRAVVVSCIILLITSIAPFAGTKWAGILSSFPSTLYALILVLHMEVGHRLVQNVIIGFSYGVSTLLIFYLLCYFILPFLGLNYGFIVIYIFCGVYLYLFNQCRKRFL